MSSSSSSSASSSAVASWYCWYSDTRSFMLDSASVNSISSMPSPVYQWRKALRRNMAVNCSETRLKSSWIAVELPMKVPAILRPRGGMSQTAVLTLFGIHSTKYDEFLFCTLSICSSTSFIDMRPEDGADGEVPALARVAGGHHVLGVEHLLGELRNSERAVLLRATAGERGETRHEEVETRERHHVDGELAQVGVELAREPEAGGHARHGGRDEVVEVAVGRGGELERAEADVVQRLVVDGVRLVRVLDELVHRERGVVRLDHRVRHLRRRDDREGVHDPVRVLLTDLGDQEGAQAGAGAAAERVGELEA